MNYTYNSFTNTYNTYKYITDILRGRSYIRKNTLYIKVI